MLKEKQNKAMNHNKFDISLQRVSSIFAIIAGICSIVIAVYQIKISKEIAREDRLKDQPIFSIQFYPDTLTRGNIYECVNIFIENNGEKPRNINTPSVSTYLKFEYQNDVKDEIQTYYVPLNSYYGIIFPTSNLTGEIASSHQLLPNNKFYMTLCNEVAYKIPKPAFGNIYVITITQINYIDKYNEQQSVYYIDESEATKEEIEEVENLSKEQFGIMTYRIEKLNVDKLLEICGISKNS